MKLSLIIPVYNEEGNVSPLFQELNEVLSTIPHDYELIFVNDGSTDGTLEKLKAVKGNDSRVKIINLKKNFGQTAAMVAGFDHAQGEYIVTLDGDLQNDPHDIPKFLAEMGDDVDVITGWRKNRKDPFLRVLLSRLANQLISLSLGIKLRDYGCTLKIFRKEIVENLNLYGEMHRFIPAVASWRGAKIKEIEVHHQPRQHGKSKYGIDRTFKVLLDLLVMVFLSEYHTKPIRFFGGMAIVTFFGGILSFLALVYMKIFLGTDMTGNPFLILSALFLLVSVQLISIGLISEINIRTYYESQDKKTYHIKDIF